MDEQFIELEIQNIIFHEVFPLNYDKTFREPEYTDELTLLESKGLAEFQQRIIKSVGKVSASMEMEILDKCQDSTFCNILDYLDKEDMREEYFIRTSKKLADKLARSFNKRNIPGGILMVFDGVTGVNSNRYIGIIKAEKHSGFSLNKKDKNKKMLEYLSELLLTPSQKLYKICLFIEKEKIKYQEIGEDTADNFTVYLYDSNLSKDADTNAAMYFYNSFLGCMIKKSDKRYTELFYIKTKEFINKADLTEEQKIGCTTALHTYLKFSNKQTLQASEFANEYFPDDDTKNNYIKYLEKHNIPTRAILKDTSGIDKKLATRKITFSSKVNISAPSDKFEQLVRIEKNQGGETTLVIKGQIQEQQ